ncbi:MAG: hypothetical protein QM489_01565 [Candidatus Izemoplasma sp.]
MKKIYVCQASGTEAKPYERVIFLIIIFSFFVLMVLVFKYPAIFISGYNIMGVFALIIVLIKMYYRRYKMIPPCLQIDSLNNLLIYVGRRIQHSTKLKDIDHFSIIEDGIILHIDKQIKIPFAEFKEIDLMHFANSMNKVIKTNVDFHTILNEDNKIQGFDYFEGNNIEELQTFAQGKILTILWWGANFFIISITSMVIIFSIIELSLWFFN